MYDDAGKTVTVLFLVFALTKCAVSCCAVQVAPQTSSPPEANGQLSSPVPDAKQPHARRSEHEQQQQQQTQRQRRTVTLVQVLC
jgi:hypothetical protein